jgi:hypothetical protein
MDHIGKNFKQNASKAPFEHPAAAKNEMLEAQGAEPRDTQLEHGSTS